MAVYMIRAGENGPVKIGKADDAVKRIASLQTAHHERLVVVRTLEGGLPEERWLHRRFASLKLLNEWFAWSDEMLSVELPSMEVVLAVGRISETRAVEPANDHAWVPPRPVTNPDWWQLDWSKEYRSDLVELVERMAAARGLSEARVANLAGRDGRFFIRLREGKGCKVDTMLSTIQFFSDNWPTNAEWPATVDRPPTGRAAA